VNGGSFCGWCCSAAAQQLAAAARRREPSCRPHLPDLPPTPTAPTAQTTTGYRVEVVTVRKLEFETDAYAFADKARFCGVDKCAGGMGRVWGAWGGGAGGVRVDGASADGD
jgi:hypothetical protein